MTICSYKRKNIFGEIIDTEIELTTIEEIAESVWYTTASIHKNVEIDEFVIMTNHMHMILIIHDNDVGVHCNQSL